MPRHIRNIVIAALLAILALAAGINGYIHHQFKTNIDQTLSSMQAFARVKYSDLSTSIFSGKVRLENVRISSAFLPEEINIGNVTLETPGFMYMLNGPENIKNGEFPEHLGFAINDFYLDLKGDTAEWLEKLVKRVQPIYASERKLCGAKSIFAPSDYREMGYTRMLSNMRIAYDFDPSAQTLIFSLTAATRNMMSLTARIKIINIASMSSAEVMQTGLPQLAKIDINYKDDTYTPRVLKYCSNLSGMSKEDYIAAEVKQSDEYFYMLWGFAPGEGLRDAYKDFLLKPEVVTVTMSPEKDFNPMMIALMRGDSLLDALNVNLQINRLLVKDLSYKQPPASFKQKFDRRIANALDFNSLLRGEPIKPPVLVNERKVTKRAPAKYHKIKLSNVAKHFDEYIRVTTKNGNQRRGQLIRLDSSNLYLQKKVSGGKFTMTVPRTKIKKIEAYFSK